jgi:cell division protein FtsI/penicillin-binding protein 2
MAKGTQLRRLIWLALLLSLAFAGLGYRLIDLQWIRHEQLSALAEKNSLRRILLEPRRGDVLDIKGNPLATSVLVKRVCANPSFMGTNQPQVARVLAPLLQESEARLIERMQPRVQQADTGKVVTNLYVVLKQKVPIKTWEMIRTNMLALSFGVDESKLKSREKDFYRVLRQKAIFAENDQERVYPNQNLAAHVVGYVGTKEGDLDGRPIIQTVGMDGIERMFNSKLEGVRGWRLTHYGLASELVRNREQDVEPRDGLNVVLTIDSVVQNILEAALQEAMEKHTPISVSGVVIRPRTGEILAMATLPNFDPNNRAAPADARRNRIITDFEEPGSTFKIVVVSGALNDKVVRPTDPFDCENGYFWYAGRTLKDDHPHSVLTVEEIITKSSNIGAAKIGIRMGANRLHDYIQNFGFGELTGIPLPGEVSAKQYVYPASKWSKLTLAQIPMGHGICATRLQMAMAMCTIANQGVLMRPMLVDRLEDKDHHVVAKYTPQRVRQVISRETSAAMVKALKTVATPEGTAPKAALEHYTVAGKTGTARKVENKVYVSKHFSSFIGFFPADNPELCISITLDEPKHGYYGGATAAPVFKQVAERAANYLNIPPEDGAALPVAETAAITAEAPLSRTPGGSSR